MSTSSPRMLNEAFISRLDSSDGQTKCAEYGSNFIRDRLREVRFCSKILPPETVTKSDCKPSVSHDTLTKIIELEPQSRAMTMGFRGAPRTRLIKGQRVEAAFFTISSELFQKTEQELLAYEAPITKIIEDNAVKDVQEICDREFLVHAEAAVQALQTEANGTTTALNRTTIAAGTVREVSVRKGILARQALTDDATVRPLQRPDIVEGFKMLDGNRLRCTRFLITDVDYDDQLQWTVDDQGDKMQSETTVEGYKYNTMLGRSFIRTIKSDILRPGNIYFFTDPQFLGKFYILNNLKFYIDKVANNISFQCWEDLSITLVNVAAVRKVELYSADATSLDTNSLLSNFIPKAEDELGAVNNRVDTGLFFPPVVNTY